MALVNIATILADTQRILKKIQPPGGIERLSYKRNRGIAIIKREEQLLEIREHGYKEQQFELTPDKLAKELKTMLKLEFPRSRKVRLINSATQKNLIAFTRKSKKCLLFTARPVERSYGDMIKSDLVKYSAAIKIESKKCITHRCMHIRFNVPAGKTLE